MNDVCQLGRPLLTASHLSLGPFQEINTQNIMCNKNLIPSLQFVHKLTQEKVTISGLPFTEKEARLSINERRPSFLLPTKEMNKMIDMDMEGTTQFKSLEVSMSNENYEISRANLSFSSEENGDDYDHTCQIKFSRFMDSQWDEEAEYFYRLFLPIKEKKWRDLVKCSAYYTNHPALGLIPCWSLIKIGFPEDRKIHIFSTLMGNCEFLVIESQSSCTYSAIKKYMYPISLSLGLVTSVAPFNYAFVVTSETPEFDGKIMGGLISLRSTIYNPYSFFITYNLGLYEGLKGIADYTLHQLCDENGRRKDPLDRPIEEQEFAALARMLFENRGLAQAALSLLSAPIDFELMGATYAVTLETICSALMVEEASSYMENDKWKVVHDELIKAVSDLYEKHLITEDHKKVMIHKLHGFNSQTNGDKLTAPFERIGYKLSGPEKKVIKERNRILHGKLYERIPKESYKQNKLFYTCMEMRKLCGILLFRAAGFKGPIFNNAIELELEEALKNKEPLFITYEEKTESPQPTEEPEASV